MTTITIDRAVVEQALEAVTRYAMITQDGNYEAVSSITTALHKALNAPQPESESVFARHMIVCPECGNKRCPKSYNTVMRCTGSNALGQQGVQSEPDPSHRTSTEGAQP